MIVRAGFNFFRNYIDVKFDNFVLRDEVIRGNADELADIHWD